MGAEADALQKSGYETFVRTGDIYCLFYELAQNLLKPNYFFGYITSNKWMRANYGEAMRRFFLEKTNPLLLVDFGGYQVFESATVDANMLIAQNATYDGEIATCLLDKSLGSLEKMSVFIRQSITTQCGFKSDSGWVILSPLEATIKNKIEVVGTPLRDWDIDIYRGILTGYNDAFIIDQETRDALIEASPKNDEIIRPILRGRDIKKYNAKFANQWIINTHNGIKERDISPINVQGDFPIIYKHLENYKNELVKRLDKGKHWSNLRNCAYLDDLEKEKLIWIELTDHPNFALDTNGYYLNNTIFFMTGNHLKYLLAFLNSRLCEWYFDKIAATSGAGTRRWIKMYIDQICVPKPTQLSESKICDIVDRLNDHFSLELYNQLDYQIYDMFELSSSEMDLITNASL